MSWPNVITVVRTGLVVVVVFLAYGHDAGSRVAAALVALLIIVGDWLDGHLARRLNQSSTLGSLLDVAADRMAESVLWIVLADLRAIPVWIPIVVISRGIFTDTLRGYALQFGYAGFGSHSLHQSRLGKFITGSAWMRTGYAALKAFCFSWLFLALAAEKLAPDVQFISQEFLAGAFAVGRAAAVAAAVVCVVRGVPVLVEGWALVRREHA